MLNFDYKTIGWAFPHEIGHTFDIVERKVDEITNNMLSEYYNTVLKGDNTWSIKEHIEGTQIFGPWISRDGITILGPWISTPGYPI